MELLLDEDAEKMLRTSQNSKRFLAWIRRLFCGTQKGPRIIPSEPMRVDMMPMIRDAVRHWDIDGTKKFTFCQHWWPGICRDIYEYVK